MTGVCENSKPDCCLAIARNIAAGKLQNARTLLLRSAREGNSETDAAALRQAAHKIAATI